MDNFEKIKKEMAEARKSAESKKTKETKSELTSSETVDTKVENEINIYIKPSIKTNKRKKAVNYYFSVDLINEIEKKAQKYNKKNSVLLEELLWQIIGDI